MINLRVNGISYQLEIEPSATLAEVLRERLRLTGTKLSCATGECGSCTVHIDGVPALACLTLAVRVEGRAITTIEGLARNGTLDPLQQAFIDNHGMQCGVCTPGMIMAAKGLLAENSSPTDHEVREAIAGNICRCGSYPNIVRSVLEAAALSKEGD